jgi:hypothetical protein
MLTPEQYRKAKAESKRAHKEIDLKDSKKDKDISTIQYDVYRPKIHELERLRDEEVEKVKKNFSEFKTKREQENQPNIEIITATKRIMSLFEIIIHTPDLALEVYTYSDRDDNGNYLRGNRRQIHYTSIDTIAQDQYKNIQVYIVPNKKPINKFSLTIRGNSLFAKVLNDERRNGYINGLNGRSDLSIVLKEGPRAEDLKNYYEKRKENTLLDFLATHTKVESEYEEAKKLFKALEWKLLYIEHLIENHSDNADFKKLHKILSTNPRNLPLLTGQLESDTGKDLLEYFFKEQH